MNEDKLQKIAEGREAEMYAWEDGTVLRLLRDPAAALLNDRQAAAIEAARASGLRVPAVLGVTTVWGRPGLIMERLEGADLLTEIGRRPWTVFSAGRISGELHAKLHEVGAPDGMLPLRAVLRRKIGSSSAPGETLRQFALRVLEELTDGDRLCHFDFHPGNIMMAGAEPVLIDWTNAARGDPDADVARTILILRLGERPPGLPVVIRVAARFARSLLLSGYLRSYRRLRPLDMARVQRWQVPVAAARFTEGIPGEVPALTRFLERESVASV